MVHGTDTKIPAGKPHRERKEVKKEMKRIMALLIALMMTLGAAAAFAEAPEENLFETLAGLEWSFSSGVGAWSTDLTIQADGTFTGEYHDSEMGDAEEKYPNGTVYVCRFSGKMSVSEKTDDKSWKIRVDQLEKEPMEETIEDGVRYVPSDAYGLAEGDEMILYAPGTPVSVLSEDMRMWAHLMELDAMPETLDCWFLMSEKVGSGFTGYQAVGMPNPWQEMTAEELEAACGQAFGLPDDAENPVYRYLPDMGLAEMQFTFSGDEFNARTQAAEEPMNISGMYYEWENEEAVQIGNCAGVFGEYKTGSTEWVQLIQWYDAEKERQYCVSVYSTDPDGLDLAAVAEQVFPVQ